MYNDEVLRGELIMRVLCIMREAHCETNNNMGERKREKRDGENFPRERYA